MLHYNYIIIIYNFLFFFEILFFLNLNNFNEKYQIIFLKQMHQYFTKHQSILE